MLPDLDHALVVAVHTVDALTGFGKDEFVNAVVTNFTLETVRMIRVIASHNGFIENGEMTDVATVGAVGADGGAV